jgi:hypothetical protein
VKALQQVAFDELAAAGLAKPAPPDPAAKPAPLARCAAIR